MKVNIIEIIEKCPRKLKLYVSILGKEVDNYKIDKNKIDIPVINRSLSSLVVHNDGSLFEGGECILFPSSNYKTWKHWQRVLFEDGDIITNGTKTIKYDKSLGLSWQELDNYTFGPKNNQDKKEVVRYEGPVPEGMIILDTANFSGLVFKVGEHITYKHNKINLLSDVEIVKDYEILGSSVEYIVEAVNGIESRISVKDNEKLKRVKQIRPYDKVLVCGNLEEDDYNIWKAAIFSHYDKEDESFVCSGKSGYTWCIPYEGNEHLLGKRNKLAEFE